MKLGDSLEIKSVFRSEFFLKLTLNVLKRYSEKKAIQMISHHAR